MNINKLRGKIVEKELNISKLAKRLEIDRSTLYRKLNNEGETLTVKEANLICSVLGLTADEAMSIFLKIMSHDLRIKGGGSDEQVTWCRRGSENSQM